MPTDLSSPKALRRLIAESGGAFAVVEEAVEALRGRIGAIDPADPDVIEVLRAHLLAVGSPSDVMKYFSLELLERGSPEQAIRTYVEVVELLARSPIQPERTYPVERAMIRLLGEKEVARALPALALLAGREVYPLSRTAARAVARIVGDTDQDSITDRLKRSDLPEATRPAELSEGVERALFPKKRSSSASSQERRRRLTLENSSLVPAGETSGCLRPETEGARQRRLRAILLGAGREPTKCGNCETPGRTKVGHVLPPSHGGTDRPGNLFVLCGGCRRRLPRSRAEGFEDFAGPREAASEPQLDLFG